MEEKDKKIDESWKESVEKEKKEPAKEKEIPIPEATFSFFITTLGIQAAIALGEIPNPMTNKTEENLDQAKYLIDIIDMLKEKTKNNLTKEEGQMVESLLYDFHLKYVSKKERINT
ncbi:MAG: DUF1844 domain-containing protein [Candidatus Omnitrophica bacterium]|nr:DUF1844 domain-containing protein [Candidatus Omnitrophota bacterium]MDD5352306.1 DUF1844 domain-containing protein [Candidatus Omnitrophota bacterium]MDD5549904.1 DUF1844 domain-containing protein [Candidatus Omnitrophota bacterium]